MSPVFTGIPTAPTAATAANDTQIANTALVQAKVSLAIANLINGAPGALDALNELAAAMGNDPNFATTMTNALATKLNISNYTAADVLAKLLTVDGAGSGLEADTLRGQAPFIGVVGNSVAVRDPSGALFASAFRLGNNQGLYGKTVGGLDKLIAHISTDDIIRIGGADDNVYTLNAFKFWHTGNSSGGAMVTSLYEATSADLYTTNGVSGNQSMSVGISLDRFKFLWQAALATGKSVYFEAIIKTPNVATTFCALRNSAGTLFGQVSTLSASYVRVRSAAISLADGTEYSLSLWSSVMDASSQAYLAAARLIII